MDLIIEWRSLSHSWAFRMMRFWVAITLLVGVVASANPIVVPPLLRAYIDSEKLVVNITPTDATFTAVFTFRSDEGASPMWRDLDRPVNVVLPVWFPEENVEDPTVGKFWRTFRKGNLNCLTTNEFGQTVLDDAIKLRICIGEHRLSIVSDIGQFWALPCYVGGSTGDLDAKETERLLEDLFSRAEHGGGGGEVHGDRDEPGFYCLSFAFFGSSALVRDQRTVTATYRQPLASENGEGRFYYLPIFENLPRGTSTDNANRYSITLVAEGCALMVKSADAEITVENGEHCTIAPKHLQAIRARTMRPPSKHLQETSR